jgi:transcriptional regulator with XRE-family HTH domain
VAENDQKAFYVYVGQRIREERDRMGLTQEALASLVSLTRTSITNIEKGRQKLLLHTFVDIVNALQSSPSELLPEIDISPEKELKELLKGKPRNAQEWVKSTLKSMREEP